MAQMTIFRARWLPIATILLLCILAVAFKLTYLGLTPNSDYTSYIGTAQLFSGLPAHAYPQRILKPLGPAVVAAIAPLAGFPTAFLFEVILFYLAFALVLYWLAFEFFEDRWLAFISALLGALSYPILRYGVDLYTETGAQFFYVLSLVLTLLYLKSPSRKWLIWNALAIGIGFLWKEYSVVAGLIFGFVLLFEQRVWRAKLGNLALLGAIALTPTILVQIWVYFAYHYTYLDWYLQGGASGFASQFTFGNLTKSIAALLGLAWVLVPFGFMRIPALAESHRRFLYAALPVPFICLLWGFVSSRLFYVMAPAFILLAVYGMARWPRWLQALAVILISVVNILCLVILSAA